MRSFYHFMMRYRGSHKNSEERRLADWMFEDHDFPKQSSSYDEVSRYFEWNSPFSGALRVFDHLWDVYEREEKE
ncbi:YozE family protein [Salirhabdus salicampi]|uniref:YozE family protein n=1 Tax=Salirhabdus salicampi TaxID=476102 RepID=UPI0020C25369|nr:sterile alpha motif-like domain-containing protein [Salirhabdus salicampi]